MRKAVVLHCDILGFKSLIKKADEDGTDEVLNRLKEALKEAINEIAMFQGAAKAAVKVEFNYKIFSDNLYASFSYDESKESSFSDAVIFCLVFARAYYANMLDRQFAVRGAISFGSDYSDESVIFSYALVKAYVLEDEKAITPRILIEDSLIVKIKEGLILPGPVTFGVLNNSILIDSDGLYFLNPFELAKDLGVEKNGYDPEYLSKGFIKRNIDYVKDVLAHLNVDENKAIVDKYTWLLKLLEWLFRDRQQIGDEPNQFKPLVFKRN